MARSTRIRNKNFIITINNPTVENFDSIRTILTRGARYVRCQVESGEGTSTPHIQLYLQTADRVGIAAVKTMLRCNHAHVEVRRGTHQQADDYCSKVETRLMGPLPNDWFREAVFGEPTLGPGQRNDLLDLKRSIDNGSTEVELFDEHFGTMLRYHKSVSHYKRAKLTKRRSMTQMTILFGPTGTGKSFRANSLYPDAFHLRRPNNGPLWWDGYTGQETVIIDEFEGWISINMFKLMIDAYPLQVAVKGAHIEFCALRVIFISNKDPREWWPKATGGVLPGPVIRRMSDPIGVCYRVDRRQAEGSDDIADGAVVVDVSVALPHIHTD